MLVTRLSPFSHTRNTIDLDITAEQLARYENGEELTQNIEQYMDELNEE